ncbi:heparan-alpha-glucosaminide N-acetyltransferase domain-containing protein [Ornithinimicrobium sediminis]|uniref:heparan-alpha-glucosaminide N-acetyltransferase domain-containing protein n=1 Tax=Ornithinimicrobium sediminis TaxID=2904603 RepID=UPI001E2C933C|nr:heparan-alpha-glucosaminide N-acetyltransferase domain-containing protein [Ornithinimicrobium sediminis]MCE0485706.1 heparan-alpha-glucosaminide N-acetyltransferase domain-containing protein [Ornithinimicrobium sediminis]
MSLDVARGLFLIASVTTASALPPVAPWMRHPAWFGVTPYDLIFPLFVTLSGVGLAFAYRSPTPTTVTVRRVLVLLSVGVLYTAVHGDHYQLSTLRLTGVLQLYAVLVLVAAALHQVTRTSRGWAVITVVTVLVSTLAYLWAEQQCPGSLLTPECNPSRWIDGRLLGEHMYAQGRLGHDPEGVVAIAGAFLTAAAGTTAGHLVLDARRGSPRVGVVRLAVWTVYCAAAGAALATVVEPFKRLWTPSFSLLAGALGLVILLVAYVTFDVLMRERGVRARDRATWPLVALGRQSLLVYFGSHLLAVLLIRNGDPSIAQRLGEWVPLPGGPGAGFVVLSLVLWWGIAMLLHRAKVYVRP